MIDESGQLTKWERLAALAMEALISTNSGAKDFPELYSPKIARAAVIYADALLKQLAEVEYPNL
jgi:hypothetical protein